VGEIHSGILLTTPKLQLRQYLRYVASRNKHWRIVRQERDRINDHSVFRLIHEIAVYDVRSSFKITMIKTNWMLLILEMHIQPSHTKMCEQLTYLYLLEMYTRHVRSMLWYILNVRSGYSS